MTSQVSGSPDFLVFAGLKPGQKLYIQFWEKFFPILTRTSDASRDQLSTGVDLNAFMSVNIAEDPTLTRLQVLIRILNFMYLLSSVIRGLNAWELKVISVRNKKGIWLPTIDSYVSKGGKEPTEKELEKLFLIEYEVISIPS